MEIKQGCQELQKCCIGNADNTKGQGSLPDYIIDCFKCSLCGRESPPKSPKYQHNKFPSARSHVRSTRNVTKDLLKKVHVKLEMVARDRYIMQQMASIKQCHWGMELQELE